MSFKKGDLDGMLWWAFAKIKFCADRKFVELKLIKVMEVHYKG